MRRTWFIPAGPGSGPTPRLAFSCALALAGLACWTPLAALSAQADVELPTSSQALDRGGRLFLAQCSRCHGAGGAGGEGPALNRPILHSAPDNEALVEVIRSGIPGTDMSGAWNMLPEDAHQVAAYVRSIGRTAVVVLPGDPEVGQALFEESDCLSCHIVNGLGEGVGPELTDVGARRGAEHLRQAVVEPGVARPSAVATMGTSGFEGYLPIRAVLPDGSELYGMRINEDDFTLQLRDDAGGLHSLRKADLQSIEREFDSSLMPGYDGVYSDAELDDLVAYLASLRGSP